jgi:cysteine desulfuration protein SufE
MRAQQHGLHDTAMDIAEIRDDFAFLDDWEDKYRYVIELGKQLPEMPDAAKTDANKVRGCVSQVWLATNKSDGRLHFEGDSDAMIVRGLVAILFAIYQDRTPQEILDMDAREVFGELGLKEHLTPQRSNGFVSMVDRIRTDARSALGS